MRIYVNRKPRKGPWGGGIKTVNKLVEELHANGHEVVYQLIPGIDIIFCIDPRPNQFGEWYQHFVGYKNTFGARIIQRVGDVGTHSKPELTSLVKQTLKFSDFFIFPSEWAREYIGHKADNFKIIHNCPMSIFHEHKNKNTTLSNTIRLVTHHWSMNPKKGFHLYEQLEDYIKENGNFEFTYIGRKPEEYNYSNHLPPIAATELAQELPKHDIYITASIEEAGANHVLEAMAAGLPVVFHKDGGSILNYCENYGTQFSDFEGMVKAINEMVEQYQFYKEKVLLYNKNNSEVVKAYLEAISKFC